MAQRAPGWAAQRHQVVERGLRAGLRGLQRRAAQHAGIAQLRQVQCLVADGDAATEHLLRAPAPEDRERQVLDGEVAARGVGGSQPAACRGVMGVVECCHVSCS